MSGGLLHLASTMRLWMRRAVSRRSRTCVAKFLPGWWGRMFGVEFDKCSNDWGLNQPWVFGCIPGGIGKNGGTLDLTLHGRLFDGVESAFGFQRDVLI